MTNRAATASAVMASRRSVASSLDFFPTPPWATRALLEEVLKPLGLFDLSRAGSQSAWDPACGAGHMALPLQGYFHQVLATDVHDWGFGSIHGLDFTMAGRVSAPIVPDWIITNPPFVLAERFVDRALTIATRGVAMLLRLQWLEGGDRYQLIFSGDRKPRFICPFAERVPMIEGVWDPEASSATAYAWFVWDLEQPTTGRTEVIHIPPGMAERHTKPQDMGLASPGEAEHRRKLKAKAAEGA
jgi:hypothetical protein